jgi:signal transduction histidine kinase
LGEVEVRLERRAADGALVLAVRDDGVGLTARAPRGGGGLGLELIRGLARKAGARLTLSGEGGGTTVAFALPAAPAAEPEPPDGIPESSREAGGASAECSRAFH